MTSNGSKAVRKNSSAKAIVKAKTKSRKNGDGDDGDDGDGYLPPNMTKRILEQAREQRDEMEQEMEQAGGGLIAGKGVLGTLAGGLARDQVCYRVV